MKRFLLKAYKWRLKQKRKSIYIPTEYILLIAISAVITIKFKDVISEKFDSDQAPANIYDVVKPQIPPKINEIYKDDE